VLGSARWDDESSVSIPLACLERGAEAVTRERLAWAVLAALSVAAVLAVFLLVPASLAVA